MLSFFRILISGPSQSGKTTFILECLKYREKVFSTKFHQICYFLPPDSQYSNDEFITKLHALGDIQVEYGLPKYTHIFNSKALPKLFIIDDQASRFL